MTLGRSALAAAARSRDLLGASRALRVVVGAVASSLEAVAVARRSRRRCLRCRAGAPGAALALWRWLGHAATLAAAWRSAVALLWRRLALSARCVVLGDSRSLLVFVGAVASSLGAVVVARRSRRRYLRRLAGAPAPASPCRRARGDVALGRSALAAAARPLGAVRRDRRLAHSACGRRRGRFLSGSGRRCAALAAPLPAAPGWRSKCRLDRAAVPAAAWRSAAALSRRRRALTARCVVLSGSRSLLVFVGTVASSLGPVAVARRSRSRCL